MTSTHSEGFDRSARWRRARVSTALGLCVLLVGCASTKVDITGAAPKGSLCQANGEHLSALVLWGVIWRPDQKDVPQREETAVHGIEAFFANVDCFTKVDIRRLPGRPAAVVPSDQELAAQAVKTNPAPDRALVITVRELGPIVRLFGPSSLVEGGTDVVLELKVVDVRTGESMANFQTHWQNGGPFVIKDVQTLPQDMSAALQATLLPSGSAQQQRPIASIQPST